MRVEPSQKAKELIEHWIFAKESEDPRDIVQRIVKSKWLDEGGVSYYKQVACYLERYLGKQETKTITTSY